jgi:N-acetylmuramoyl-L-alanine amidase
MKLIVAVTLSGVLLMGQSDQPATRLVTAVRHWSLPDVTRVAVEVSGPFQFHSDRLHNPERVYYDIVNAHVRIASKIFYSEVVGDSMLEKIRVAENTPGTARVVLDLAASAAATTTILTNPDRLILELRTAPSNPLRTETPAAQSSGAQSSVAQPATSAPPVLPPPPTPAVKPAPASAKLPVKTDVPVVPPVRVPGLSPEAAKPETTTGGSPAIPAPVLAVEELHPAAGDPGPSEVAKAARATSSGTNSLIRTLGLKINRVVIDPGHGGHDQGTEGAKGLLEKDVVLDIALRVGKLVQENMGADVIYTRRDDTFVPLEGRTALANEKKADLFLSIHANSSPYPNISGVETYYLNITGTKDAVEVAKRENGTTHDSIFDLQDLVKKIALHDKSEESQEFAKRVEGSLYAFNLKNFPANKDRGVKTAPFIVLIGANMPSVLAEIGFLTNSKEEALLKKPEYRQKLAEALYKGMERYTESLSHFQAAAKP